MATYAPVSSVRSSSRPTAAAASTASAAAAARRRGQDTPIRAATGSVVTFVWGSCVWTVAVFWHDAVELRGFSALVVLFAVSAVLFLVSIVTAACVPPGRSPDDWPWNPRAPLPPGRAAGTSTTVEVQRLARKIVYCPHCERYKPDRTHHCNRCQQCVPVYDHHCPFIGQCVVARNRKFVELTLFYACWMTMWLVCIQIYLVAAFGFPGGLQSAANALGVVVAVLGCVALLAPPDGPHTVRGAPGAAARAGEDPHRMGHTAARFGKAGPRLGIGPASGRRRGGREQGGWCGRGAGGAEAFVVAFSMVCEHCTDDGRPLRMLASAVRLLVLRNVLHVRGGGQRGGGKASGGRCRGHGRCGWCGCEA